MPAFRDPLQPVAPEKDGERLSGSCSSSSPADIVEVPVGTNQLSQIARFWCHRSASSEVAPLSAAEISFAVATTFSAMRCATSSGMSKTGCW
jgi:hypothetical protein